MGVMEFLSIQPLVWYEYLVEGAVLSEHEPDEEVPGCYISRVTFQTVERGQM